MIEVGRLCVKIAGRDAGKKCVIVDVIDNNMVLIDGGTRRRKCNVSHLLPLKETLKIKKSASHIEVGSAFKNLKLEVWDTKPKEKTERPRRVRKVKEAPVEEAKAKPEVKEDKKEAAPEKKAEEKVEAKPEVKKEVKETK